MFSYFNSHSSVSFASNLQFKRIEVAAVDRLTHQLALLLAVLFIISNAVDDPFEISLVDGNACPEFGQW
jgi:hypothetical protein